MPKERYSYKDADFAAMIRDLEDTNWKEEYILTASDKNIEELWISLKGKLLSLREICT